MSLDPNALRQWTDDHLDELISDFRRLLNAPSVEGPAEPNAPFGAAVRQAMDVTLDLGKKFGFRCRDFDGYAQDMEIGDGEEFVASLAHVDVVPPGNGWDSDPWAAEIRDGYIYARGAEDDKGAAMASIYAVRALKELGTPLKRRVRIVIGGDEESGFCCVEHYLKVVPERPVAGFSPDGAWPFVFAEKGILNLKIEKKVASQNILKAEGGERHNMVPDRASATVKSAEIPATLPEGVSAVAQADHAVWTAAGKSAHGSRPSLGVNAVALLLEGLQSLNLPDNDAWLNNALKIARSQDGDALGIQHEDEVTGPLTSNLGVFSYDGQTVRMTINIRYPATWSLGELMARCEPTVRAMGFEVVSVDDSPPHYVPKDNPFLQAIGRIYREETGDETPPQTMGGGTYARVLPPLVAIGAGFEGDGAAHEPNERIAIESMRKLTYLYARMLYELANL